MLEGLPAADGIAMGSAYWLPASPDPAGRRLTPEEVEGEATRFLRALHRLEESGVVRGAFISYQDLGEAVVKVITEERIPSELAVLRIIDGLIDGRDGFGDEELFDRTTGMEDLGRELRRVLLAEVEHPLQGVEEPVVVVAHELRPSDALVLDPEKVLAVITEAGGAASHTAILAASLEIPAVVGLGDLKEEIRNGDRVVVDGSKGIVFVNPGLDTLDQYQQRLQEEERRRVELAHLADLACDTTDGTTIQILANVGGVRDSQAGIRNGAQGIGLLRTEFLYLNRLEPPNEEEQVEAYRAVIEAAGGHPVTIRTLDVGGDKPLPFLRGPREANPSLGWRSLRISLDRRDLFRTQIRAIHRAGRFGPVRIMFPLVGSLEEIRMARALVRDTAGTLPAEWRPDTPIPLGVLIETPAAALLADRFAREVDFFSVGTNDLVQYTLAVDRLNEKVAHLYDPFHPAIWALLKRVADAARAGNTPVIVCGEMAGDVLAVPLLLGVGFDSLSMTPSALPTVKHLIRHLSLADARALWQQAQDLGTGGEVREVSKRLVARALGGNAAASVS